MLNFKQREARENLQARCDTLRDEKAFALEGNTPWRHEKWQETNGVVTCEKHGEYQTRILTGPEYRGVTAVTTSCCPTCMAE